MKYKNLTGKALLSLFGLAFFIGWAAYADDNDRSTILTNLVNDIYEEESSTSDLTEAETVLLARQLSSCQLTDENGAISSVFMETYGCEALIQRVQEEGISKQFLEGVIAATFLKTDESDTHLQEELRQEREARMRAEEEAERQAARARNLQGTSKH